MADWERVGNEFIFPSPRDFMLFFNGDTIDSSTIAFTDASTDTISDMIFDGTNWSQGTRYSTPPSSVPSGFCRMTDGLFAFVTGQFDRIYAITRSAGVYSNGPFITRSGMTRTSCSRLADDTIAVASTGGGQILETYTFNGSSWAKVGNTFNLAPFGVGSTAEIQVETIGPNTVALIDTTTRVLRAMEFDGSNWTPVGNPMAALPTNSSYFMEKVRDNIVVIISTFAVTIQAYEFDGTDWSTLGDAGSIEGFPGQIMVPIQLTETLYGVANHQGSAGFTSNMKTYQFNALPSGEVPGFWEKLADHVTQGAS